MKKEYTTDEIKKSYEGFHTAKTRKSELFKDDSRYKFLRDLLHNFQGNILVVGCGSKYEMSIVPAKCKAVGLDISETAINKTKSRYPQYKYIVGDAMNMKFKENTFDCIVCSEVIEHLPNDEKFLESAHRVLKPKGVLIITTPNWNSSWGLARTIGEFVLRRPVTSGGQIIDHWYTFNSLKKKTDKHFRLEAYWGLWFLPPFGLGKLRIPSVVEYPIFRAFFPIEKKLRFMFPKLGHMLAFYLINKKQNTSNW